MTEPDLKPRTVAPHQSAPLTLGSALSCPGVSVGVPAPPSGDPAAGGIGDRQPPSFGPTADTHQTSPSCTQSVNEQSSI